jgi:8-oxo-dGTP pyrophosphatase MutT (NUDIX family)
MSKENLCEALDLSRDDSLEKVKDGAKTNSISEIKQGLNCYGVILFTAEFSKIVYVVSKNRVLGFPKGKIEKGETSLECTYRELREETGIIEEYFDLIPGIYFYERSSKKNISVGYYVGIIKDHALDLFEWSYDLDEICEVGLMDYEKFNQEMFSEAPNYNIKDTRIETVRDLRNWIKTQKT